MIINANFLQIDKHKISKLLYEAVNNINIDELQYGELEKNMVSAVIRDIINQKDISIKIDPKVLAYYLLITYPEYIKENEIVDSLVESLSEFCDGKDDIA